MLVSRLQRKELNRLQTHHKVSAYSPGAILIVSVRIRHLVGGRRPTVISQRVAGLLWASLILRSKRTGWRGSLGPINTEV